MSISYLIWAESLNSPIIQGQVIAILKRISCDLSDSSIYLIAFKAIYPFRIKNPTGLKKELKEAGVYLITIPVVFSEWWFFAKWYQIPLIFVQAFPAILLLSLIKNIRLFHCRSYPITLPAIMVKKLRNIKVIFDPRSDFPEENVTAGRWKINSLSFRIWKVLEKIYLRNSDRTVAIANTYVAHYKKIYGAASFSVIPNNVDTEKFKRDEEFRQHFRFENNIKPEEILFCYCGSLGSHWHDPEIYARYIIKFRELKISHRFLFITPNLAPLKLSFARNNINPEEYIAVSSKFEDVPKYLSAADIGIVLMDKPKIAMAIKTAEYLAMELPIITNSNLAGAKEIIEGNGVGMLHDISSDLREMQRFIEKFIENRKEFSNRCRRLAEEVFSNKAVAKRYVEIYQELK